MQTTGGGIPESREASFQDIPFRIAKWAHWGRRPKRVGPPTEECAFAAGTNQSWQPATMVETFAQHCATGAQHSFLRIKDFMDPPFVMDIF
jgi:hypothetical protein